MAEHRVEMERRRAAAPCRIWIPQPNSTRAPMPDIITVLACLSPCLDPTTRRQLRRITEAMMSMTGRVTMRGIARWAGPGGRYRTVQRFCKTRRSWGMLQWMVIRHHLLDQDDVIVMAGDDVVVTKAGKQTHGLGRFFSSLYGKKVPGLGFLSLSLLSVKRRTSYPVMMEQLEIGRASC